MHEENWVNEAVAKQEDYLLRVRSCGGVLGREHQFRDFGRPSADGTIKNAHMWKECFNCGCAASFEDYDARLSARAGTDDV